MANAPAASSRWSDEEKIATLLAIIKANGSTPNWKETKIPIGRTMQSTQKMYEGLKKQAAAVEMVGADKQTPSKVMGPRKSPIKKRGTGAAATGTNQKKTTNTNGKRGRPPTKQHTGGGEEDGGGLTDDEAAEDDGDVDRKRVKLESSDQQPMFGEEGDPFGFEGV